ncbi:MAG TPA: Ig-like domain-containing protein [Candidatus Sulfotelmatobacter sp.]
MGFKSPEPCNAVFPNVGAAQSLSRCPGGRAGLFSGGVDASGNSVAASRVFDPTTLTVSGIDNSQPNGEANGSLTEMRASSPQDGDQRVALDALIAVRFSRPVQMASVNHATLSLQGREALVMSKVVAAEGGMLGFVTPATQLMPGSTYTVKVAGVIDMVSRFSCRIG